MGGGSWKTESYVNYSLSTGKKVNRHTGVLDASYTAQDLYTSTKMQPELDPYKVVRECRDSDEHPNTIPVILALDVTGSMGTTIAEVAKRLNEVMTNLYEQVKDVEFMVMGIGDLSYDVSPIQVSQFESDVRIAEWLDKIWFERGGGGNGFESYTAAWYFGLSHTDLDCWNRGKKGIIITIGDEPMNPYLPHLRLNNLLGDSIEADVETNEIYDEAKEKFDIYHLAVDDRNNCYRRYSDRIQRSFSTILDNDHFKVVNLDNIVSQIVDIVVNANSDISTDNTNQTDGISW